MTKERYDLTDESLEHLFDLLFLYQSQVIVRLGEVVVGMFDYEGLRRFLKPKGIDMFTF